MKFRALSVPLSLILLLVPVSSAYAESGMAVPWISLPPAVQNAANQALPNGSSIGKVEKKILAGKEVFDVHMTMPGGHEEVIEIDKKGQRLDAQAEPEAAETDPPPSPEAAPAPRPQRTGLEEYEEKQPAEGSADDAYEAGRRYEYGSGGAAKDYAQAMKWYQKAAEHGSAAAQFAIGGMYDGGLGVKQDNFEAVKWYWKSAQSNYPAAQYNLGQFYAKGLAVATDWAQAYFWFALAANSRFPYAAEERDAAAAHLGAGQLASAQKQVQDWKPTATPAPFTPAAPIAPAKPGPSIAPPPLSNSALDQFRPEPPAGTPKQP